MAAASVDGSDQLVTLFKQSQGFANTSTSYALSQESIVSRPAIFADRVFTDSLPDSAPSTFTNDATWLSVNGKRDVATDASHLVRYTDVPLTKRDGTNPSLNQYTYDCKINNINYLTNVLLPRVSDATPLTNKYTLQVTISGAEIPNTNYILDRFAGILIIKNVGEPDSPKITFWRYEGKTLATPAVPSFTSFTVGGTATNYYPVIFDTSKSFAAGEFRLLIKRSLPGSPYAGVLSLVIIGHTKVEFINGSDYLIYYFKQDSNSDPLKSFIFSIAYHGGGKNLLIVYLRGGFTYNWSGDGITSYNLNKDGLGISIAEYINIYIYSIITDKSISPLCVPILYVNEFIDAQLSTIRTQIGECVINTTKADIRTSQLSRATRYRGVAPMMWSNSQILFNNGNPSRIKNTIHKYSVNPLPITINGTNNSQVTLIRFFVIPSLRLPKLFIRIQYGNAIDSGTSTLYYGIAKCKDPYVPLNAHINVILYGPKGTSSSSIHALTCTNADLNGVRSGILSEFGMKDSTLRDFPTMPECGFVNNDESIGNSPAKRIFFNFLPEEYNLPYEIIIYCYADAYAKTNMQVSLDYTKWKYTSDGDYQALYPIPSDLLLSSFMASEAVFEGSGRSEVYRIGDYMGFPSENRNSDLPYSLGI
jgi:hypothetical protein